MSSMMPGPSGFSIPIPTGVPVDYNKLILDDPFYKQNLEWMQADKATAQTRLLADRDMAEQLYKINVQQAQQSASGGGGGGGDYGLAAAQEQAALQKEVAAHDDALRKEQVNEQMASRGMFDSGQRQWEQQEREYDLSTMLKGIDIDLAGRARAAQSAASAAASARSSAQAGMQLQLQEMAARHAGQMTQYGYGLEDLQTSLARSQGEAAFDTYNRLLATGQLAPGTKMAAWDAASGLYKTSDGAFYDAAGNPTSWSPQPAYVPPAYTPPAYSPPPAAAAPAVDYSYNPPPAEASNSNNYYSNTYGDVGYKKPLLEY